MDFKLLISENLELINTIVGFGSLISSVVAVITLKEVIKQRLSSYKPEVLIKSFNLSISKNPLFNGEGELLLYKTIPFNDYSVNTNEVKFSVLKNYKIDNIGFGPAKNIRCSWEFDVKRAIEMIKIHLPEHYKIEVSKYDTYTLYSLQNLLSSEFYYSASTEVIEQRIDYISPINVTDHYQLHALPDDIVFAHYLYLIFKFEMTALQIPNFYFCDFDDFPKPTLIINYRDMNNKKYKQKSTFKISAVATQMDDVIRMDKEFAFLNFELL